MSSARDDCRGSRNAARLATAIPLALMVGLGYLVAPQVEGASAVPPVTGEEDMALRYLQSECVAGGLVFASCNLDF